jgi:hypothetical protein
MAAVFANHLGPRRDQRAAGVLLERRVGLDDVVHQPPRPRAEGSADRAHDAGRCGMVEAVRIADRDRDLADTNPAGIAKARPGQLRAVDPQHGQVGIAILANRLGAHRAAVRKGDRRAGGAVHDVAVRQDEPVGRDDDTRATAALPR